MVTVLPSPPLDVMLSTDRMASFAFAAHSGKVSMPRTRRPPNFTAACNIPPDPVKQKNKSLHDALVYCKFRCNNQFMHYILQSRWHRIFPISPINIYSMYVRILFFANRDVRNYRPVKTSRTRSPGLVHARSNGSRAGSRLY